MKYIYSFLFIFLLYQQSNGLKELKFVRYTANEGLVHDDVLTISQDKFGFMWFGTKYGCSKFDGISFTNYQYSKDVPGTIADGWINSIICDDNNMLWFSIAGGGNKLMKYSYETGNFNDYSKLIHEKLGLDGKPLNYWCSMYDSKGRIWLEPYLGFFYFDTKTEKIGDLNNQKGAPEKLIDNTKYLEDKDSNIWFASQNGLYVYIDKTREFLSFTHAKDDEKSLSSNTCTSIFQDSEFNIWIGTSQGLNRLDYPFNADSKIERFVYSRTDEFSISNNHINAINEDKNGDLIIGTLDGLCIYDKKTGKFHRHYNDEIDNESINSNLITSIYKDTQNNIWVGTNAGIGKLQDKKFTSYTHSNYKNSLSHNKVQAFCEVPPSEIWIATPKGIDIFNRESKKFRQQVTNTNNDQGLHGAPIALSYDKSNNGVWIGTWRGGLSFSTINSHSIQNYYEADILQIIKTIFTLINDEKGNLWIDGTSNGIYRFNKKENQLENFDYSKYLEKDIKIRGIRAFLIDSEGDLWFGSLEGLFLAEDIEKGKIKYFLEKSSILKIIETSDKQIWAASQGGIYRINKKDERIKHFGVLNGLPTEQIFAIHEDKSNNLWMSSDKGLIKCTPKGDSLTNITIFRKEEGLSVGDFLPRSSAKLSDGSLIFGGTKGFCIFNPATIIEDTITPDVFFTSLHIANEKVKPGEKVNNQLLLNKSFSLTKSIVLNHKNNAFSIEFSGLQYNMPQYNKYAYRLDGYDFPESKWNYKTSAERKVDYMNLPDGEYVFKVKAANSYGLWNDTPAVLQIKILPPWWQTWWFKTMTIIFIFVTTLSFYLYRVNALKRQKRILEQKVVERTSELREANSQLEEKQEEILQQNEEIITVNNQLKVKNEEIESSRNKLEKAFKNITLLSEFGQKLTATFDFNAINSMIYSYVSSLMETAAFGIGIYNDQRKIIDFPYFMEKGEPIPYFYKALSSEKSLSVRCFKNSEEIFINDLSTEYKHYLSELPDIQTSKLPSSVIHLPLSIENRTIGTLTVNSFKKFAYNQSDIANLRTLASYISIALDNSKAYRIIRSKNEQISGSIRYGQTIQQAMLPPKKLIDKHFDSFILFRPKDVVSGDFYWFASVNNPLNPQGLDSDNTQNPEAFEMGYYFLAVVDCTGHGVPGAFMSMIGSRLLNDIVLERKIYSPAKILEQLNVMVRKALRQDTTDNHDGMDVCLCRFQQIENEYELTYAGAKRALLHIDSNEKKLYSIEGTRMSIGGIAARRKIIEFTDTKLKLKKNDMLYLSSDGLVDQCNPQKRKFSQKKLDQLVQEICHLPVEEQLAKIEKELDDFQQGFEQRDDITLVGVKV